MKIVLILAAFLPSIASAESCEEQQLVLRQNFANAYQAEIYRVVTNRVQAALMANELAELTTLSKNFNSVPHDTPEHQDDRFKMQARAKEIVRMAVTRAGYRIMNPATGDPFDAIIGGKSSADGYLEYRVEVRSLLVMADPRPHVTLWLERFDLAHNPWHVVTVGFTAKGDADYVSWKPSGGARIQSTLDGFLKAQLPTECQ
jgi:hypothetical protein